MWKILEDKWSGIPKKSMLWGEKWWNCSRLNETKRQLNERSELRLVLVWGNHSESILGTCEEILIWTGVLDNIRELLVIFLIDNLIEIGRRMSLLLKEACRRILKLSYSGSGKQVTHTHTHTHTHEKRLQKRRFNTGDCL